MHSKGDKNMRKNLGKQTYFFPLPVLIIGTYDEEGKANAMNAAWGGIHDTDEVYLCLSTDHKTTDNIKLKQEFTIAFADKGHVVEADYVGIFSGTKVDKVKKANLHAIKSEFVDAPIFEEFPVSLDCKVKSLHDDGQTTMVVASILNVSAKEEVMNNGKIDVTKLHIISYEPVTHGYLEMGEKVGQAFKDGLKLK